MNSRHAMLLIAIGTVGIAAQGSAQPLAAGATVRVRLECGLRLPCRRFVASADAVRLDSLTLAARGVGVYRVAWPEVLEISVSERRYRPVLKGAAIGLGVGLVVGGIAYYSCEQSDSGGWYGCGIVVPIIGGGGLTLGTIGGLLTRVHKWRELDDWPGRRLSRE